jgi:hypothetical protein
MANLVPKILICSYDISTACDQNIIGIFGAIVAEKGEVSTHIEGAFNKSLNVLFWESL